MCVKGRPPDALTHLDPKHLDQQVVHLAPPTGCVDVVRLGGGGSGGADVDGDLEVVLLLADEGLVGHGVDEALVRVHVVGRGRRGVIQGAPGVRQVWIPHQELAGPQVLPTATGGGAVGHAPATRGVAITTGGVALRLGPPPLLPAEEQITPTSGVGFISEPATFIDSSLDLLVMRGGGGAEQAGCRGRCYTWSDASEAGVVEWRWWRGRCGWGGVAGGVVFRWEGRVLLNRRGLRVEGGGASVLKVAWGG